MKKIITLIIAMAIGSQTLWAKNLTLREQLVDLNACWKNKNQVQLPADPCSKLDEVGIIRMHLSLVEKTLRNSAPENMSSEQLANRNYCLDILHNYWTEGVFPKNLYHNKRTPYFIDKYGTACAVGQLIISTGNYALAQKISFENNYDYIKSLNEKYPQIQTWADKNGFTIEELAWIQPSYINCDTSCTQSAAISTSSGQAPYTYLWSDGQTSQNAINLCPGTSYSCIITDAYGISISPANCDIFISASIYQGTNQITLPNAFPFYFNLNSTIDDGGCNGTASADILAGAPPFNFYWSSGGQTYQTINGLCQGTYWVTISDANSCIKTDSVVILSSVGLENVNNTSIILYPNPVSDKLIVHSEKMLSENSSFRISNTLNQLVLAGKLSNNMSEIDVSGLEKGTYLVSIDNESRVLKKRFIKN